MTKEERLLKLQARRDQLNVRIQALANQKTKIERAKDTRRKILVGAAVLDSIGRGEWDQVALDKILDRFLTRPIDRELFNLPTTSSK